MSFFIEKKNNFMFMNDGQKNFKYINRKSNKFTLPE